MRPKHAHQRAIVALAVMGAASATVTRAWADRFWVGPANGSWNNAANWSATAGGAGGAGVPLVGEFVYIRHSDAIDRNIVLDVTTPLLGRLRLGNTSTGLTTLIQSTNVSLNVVAEFEGSNSTGLNSSGVHTQSAGLNTVTWFLSLGDDPGTGTGTYNLSGTGSMVFNGTAPQAPTNPGIYVGANEKGVFNQNGGTVSITYDGAPLHIGFNGNGVGLGTGAGTYNLLAGSLTVKAVEYIGFHGLGTFVQSGGVHNVGTPTGPNFLELALYSGSTGSYFLSGGSLNSNAEVDIGNAGAGTFSQSAGTHTIGAVYSMYLGWDTTGNGTYLLSGSGVVSASNPEYIGYSGKGTVIQSGGSNSAPSMLIGYNPTGEGTYNVSGGSLQVSSGGLYVGTYGKGSIDQSAGAVSIGAGSPFIIGYAGTGLGMAVSFGTYTLGGTGVLTTLPSEYVGYFGAGTFIQSGGTHTIGTPIAPANLAIASAVNSSGNLLLSDGMLTVNGTEIVGSGGTGVVNQSGGTHTVGTGISPQSLLVGSSNSSGGYTLSAGVLTVLGKEVVGSGAIGNFTQSGGSNTLGAAAIAGSLEIGLGMGVAAQGTYTLSGSAALMANGNELIGHGAGTQTGTGTFLHSGGTNTVGTPILPRNLYIGRSDTSLGSGTYLLSGTGNLLVSGSAYLGGSELAAGGTGVLTINGGSMTVTNTLKVWNTAGSTVTFNSGALTVGSFDASGNPARFVWASGSLGLNNSYTLASGAFLGPSVNLTAVKSLDISGTTSGDGTASVTLNGGIFSTGSLTNGALLQFNTGTFRLTNASLTVGAAGLFGSTVQLNPNQHIDIPNAAVIVDPGALLSFNGLTSSLSGGSLTNNGIISGTGRVSNDLNNAAGGSIRATGAEWLQFWGANNTNDGQMSVLNGGQIEFTGPLTNSSTGMISGRGILRTGGTGLANYGNVALSGGITDFYGDVTNQPGAQVIISGLANVTFWDDVSNNSGGIIKVSVGSSATFFGEYSGDGIIGGGNVDFEGDLSPGFSPAVLGIAGNVSFGHDTKLKIELGGLTRGSQYDAIDVTGAAALDGKIGVTTLDGFIPLPGESFDVLTFGSRSGDLAVLNETGFAGLSFTKVYTATTLSLDVVGLAGDANLDGKVDLYDLVALAINWRAAGSWLNGDFDGSGFVDANDLGLLATHWQAGVGPPLGQSLDQLGLPPVSVPEPAHLAGFVIAAGILPRRRRRN